MWRAPVDTAVVAVAKHKRSGQGSANSHSTGRNGLRMEMNMTASMFRTISTCIAALFVSTLLVTATTSMAALV